MAVGARRRAQLLERTPDMVEQGIVEMAKAGRGLMMCTSYKVE